MIASQIIIFLSAVLGTATMLVYSRVKWWKNQVGCYLMAHIVSIALSFDLLAFRVLFLDDTSTFRVIRTAILMTIPLSMAWLLKLLISEQRNARMKTLVIQLGHQGRPPNPGSRGAPGEQEFTALIGQRAGMLNREGWQVRTVIADPPRELYRGDAFFAVHADGSLDPNVRGASIGYQNREGEVLAKAWNWNYVQEGYPAALWKPANYTDNLHYYYGVREAIAAGNIRACIIECGTITNAVDKALMMGHPEMVLRAIGRSLGMEFDDMETTSPVQLADGTPGEKNGTMWPAHLFWSRTYRDLKVMAARLDIVAGQVSSQESRILAGVRGIVEADANATVAPEQLQQLISDLRAGLPESITNQDIQDAMRTVLTHGTEGQ